MKEGKFKFFAKRTITRKTSGEKIPYMIRWNLFECPLFSIKLHKIMVSDDACLHDHPWTFISIILKGGYVEESWTHTNNSNNHVRRIGKKLYGPGSILFRPSYYAHRLDIYQPAWTLVITFRKTRQWGFFTKDGWVPGDGEDKELRCE